MADQSSSLHVSVVTPEETVLDAAPEFVVLPLFDGELGVLPGHSPMIGRLGFGEMRLTIGGEVKSYYVDAGFAQVADNEVTVLTGRAMLTSDIDSAAAQAQLDEGLARTAATPDEGAMRDRMVSQARAQLRLAGK